MMGWLSRLFSGHANKTPEVPKAHRTEPAQELYVPANGLPAEPAPEADALPAFPWLFDCAPLTDAPLSEAERAALDTLSRTLALPALPDNLLPRAAALIPQLIALVRQTDLPTPAIAERIGKDAVLTAEVLRLASSPYYRVQGDVNDLQLIAAIAACEMGMKLKGVALAGSGVQAAMDYFSGHPANAALTKAA